MQGLEPASLLQVHLAGEVPYRTAWPWQQARLAQMIRDPQRPDGLLLLTHPPVYTLGAVSYTHLTLPTIYSV